MAITPALLTRMSSGPLHAAAKARALDRSDRVQGADGDGAVAGAIPDLRGHAFAGRGVADGERDRRACIRQCPRGLDTDTRRRAGDDGPLTGQIDSGDDLAAVDEKPKDAVRGYRGGCERAIKALAESSR